MENSEAGRATLGVCRLLLLLLRVLTNRFTDWFMSESGGTDGVQAAESPLL